MAVMLLLDSGIHIGILTFREPHFWKLQGNTVIRVTNVHDVAMNHFMGQTIGAKSIRFV